MKKQINNHDLASRNFKEKNSILEKITATIVQINCRTIMDTSLSFHHHLGNVAGFLASINMNIPKKSHIIGWSGKVIDIVSDAKLICIEGGIVKRNIQ